MASKVIHAYYNDDDILMQAVKKVKATKHHIEEVYCPFPVHGLDKAMGLAPTRIAITSFMYGCPWVNSVYCDDELYHDR